MKGLIKVGYGCNENCTFCHTADMRAENDSSERVLAKIERARALGYDMVVLSGGEPSIRPELRAWARRVAALGMDFGLVTNGLVLSYPDLADELIERSRLRYVYMSLHGGSPKIHASLVRADSFARAVGAIDVLHGRIPDLTVNCVVTRQNVEHLDGVVDLLLRYPALTLKFSMTTPKGGAASAFDTLVPDVRRVAERVKAAILRGIEARGAAPGPRFAHDGIPFCLLEGLEDAYDDLKTHDFATMIEVDEDDYVPVDEVAKVHGDACRDCTLRGACPGLYRAYFEARGDEALRPRLGGVRSNSFHYVPERDLAWPRGASCPVFVGGTSPYDRARTLFLRLPDRLRLFRTKSRDFSDEEIGELKRLGQIYVDVSGKLAPDDFARDLRALAPARACRGCEAAPRCTGAFELVRADLFGRDDARLLDILGALRGRVLDIGCGEGRYLGAVAESARAGALDYVGLDPDETRLASLARRYPFARFVAAPAEALPAELAPLDHVLVLRSYNHLRDPGLAIGRAVEMLRPGGTLTVVDNVAFGLVRQAHAAARAECAPENAFEHQRNEGADEAEARLAALPLRLLERQEVGPGRSNQWLLRYERAHDAPPEPQPDASVRMP